MMNPPNVPPNPDETLLKTRNHIEALAQEAKLERVVVTARRLDVPESPTYRLGLILKIDTVFNFNDETGEIIDIPENLKTFIESTFTSPEVIMDTIVLRHLNTARKLHRIWRNYYIKHGINGLKFMAQSMLDRSSGRISIRGLYNQMKVNLDPNSDISLLELAEFFGYRMAFNADETANLDEIVTEILKELSESATDSDSAFRFRLNFNFLCEIPQDRTLQSRISAIKHLYSGTPEKHVPILATKQPLEGILASYPSETWTLQTLLELPEEDLRFVYPLDQLAEDYNAFISELMDILSQMNMEGYTHGYLQPENIVFQPKDQKHNLKRSWSLRYFGKLDQFASEEARSDAINDDYYYLALIIQRFKTKNISLNHTNIHRIQDLLQYVQISDQTRQSILDLISLD